MRHKKGAQLTSEQTRYLRERLAKSFKPYELKYRGSPPPEVKAAQNRMRGDERIVMRWRRAMSGIEEKGRLRMREEHSKVSELILFGTPEDALKAVREFERTRWL